jgi:hypothetical protein
MKTLFRTILMILLIMLIATTVFAESTTMKFSDPSEPGLIKVTGNGDITVTGYNGTDVIIETEAGEESAENPVENEKAKGLKRISGSSVNVINSKDSNTIEINRSMQDENSLTIKVPINTSFKTGQNGSTGWVETSKKNKMFKQNIQNMVINSVFTGLGGGILEGDIDISNLSGDIEASTLNGNITLQDVSGTVLINTVDGDIEAAIKNIKNDRPMSFSTVDGDIDITIPSSTKADLKVKTVDGEVFTDFEIELIALTTEEQNTASSGFVGLNFGHMLGNTIYGKINGGGPEIRMSNIDGDIYVRKGQSPF